MTPTERTGDRHVECYVRDSLPEPAACQCDRLTERLSELAAGGSLSASVLSWDKRVRRGDPVKTRARDRYDEFTAWADDRGMSLHPFFGTRECYSTETGDLGVWIVFPALCLAVYEDGDLTVVYPHADGDDYRSVVDGLDALERGTDGASGTGDASGTDREETDDRRNGDSDDRRNGDSDDREQLIAGSPD